MLHQLHLGKRTAANLLDDEVLVDALLALMTLGGDAAACRDDIRGVVA